MLGWEFPPYISGGLGTACYGLTKALDQLGTEVAFVLPRPVPKTDVSHLRLISPHQDDPIGGGLYHEDFKHLRVHAVNVGLYPYGKPETPVAPVGQIKGQVNSGMSYSAEPAGLTNVQFKHPTAVSTHCPPSGGDNYVGDLYAQTDRYSELACHISRQMSFDVIHAHDWMTYPAGISVTSASRRPLVIHVHSTEFDRSGKHVNQWVYGIERMGMNRADHIIAVSDYTKRIRVDRYGVAANKVSVVYNGVEQVTNEVASRVFNYERDEKVVLFLGRITMQKGPEYFMAAAKKVLGRMENVKFIVAGSGDMFYRMIEYSASLGIGHKVLFTGFLRGIDVDRAFAMADLYVMPSVSEPFGISPLEAMIRKVPVIISKQSGVSELAKHALKVDFWDIDEMANKIISVLRHSPLRKCLSRNGFREARQISWKDSAEACNRIYVQVRNHAA